MQVGTATVNTTYKTLIWDLEMGSGIGGGGGGGIGRGGIGRGGIGGGTVPPLLKLDMGAGADCC